MYYICMHRGSLSIWDQRINHAVEAYIPTWAKEKGEGLWFGT